MGLFDIFKKKKVDPAVMPAADQEKAGDPGASQLAEQESHLDSSQTALDQDQPSSINEKSFASSDVDQAAGADQTTHNDSDLETTADQEIGDDQKTKSVSSQLNQSQSTQAAYTEGLTQSRRGFADRINRFLSNFRSVDEEFFENLEDTLIGADLGFDLAIQISNRVREAVKIENIKDPEQIRSLIIQQMVEQYDHQGENEDQSMHFAPAGQPTVVLFVGVNGVGKTTTVGKLAARYRQAGKKVLLAAADTFRAGAVKQLQEWGDRVDVPVVTGPEKADPASVVYTAVEKAQTENFDILFVDTAGRLQNNVNLMQELSKMNRVVKKVLPAAPQEVLLVLDATTGQNALQQAKLFQDSSDVTGIVLTKMDGTAKGGIVFAIRDRLHLPVKWIGFGEKTTDLRIFSAEDFVYGLFKDLV